MTAIARSPERYMPIRLKALITRHGLTQAALAAAVHQSDGATLSVGALSQLINWDVWPRLTPRAEIRAQISAFLRAGGIPEDEIATAFDHDPEDPAKRGRGPRPALAAARREKDAAHPDVEPLEPVMLSPEAKKHFRLFRNPFTDDVQSAEDVFLSPDVRYVREAMWTTARLGGFLAVVGESGAGKTVLRRDFLDRIAQSKEPIRVIFPRTFDKGRLTASAICTAIVDDLHPGQPMKASLEANARMVEKLLTESSRAGNTHCLVIEEAHDLNTSTLKYLKRFWELEDGFRKLLSIILIGQPELRQRLDERINWEAREVIRRCEIAELLPLDRHLEEYLALKLKRVGSEPAEVVDPSAYEAIRARLTRPRRGNPNEVTSMLYPLVVNNLVTRAMNLAASIGAPRLDRAVVEEV